MNDPRVNDVVEYNDSFWIIETVSERNKTVTLRAAQKVHSHGYDQFKPSGMIQVRTQQTIKDSAKLIRRGGEILSAWGGTKHDF